VHSGKHNTNEGTGSIELSEAWNPLTSRGSLACFFEKYSYTQDN
jgi:hypothetical protein